MVSVSRLPEETVDVPHVIAVGTFDGLHRGHRAILERAIDDAQTRGLPSAVLTFEPDPVTVLQGMGPEERRLLTREDKIGILSRIGFDKIYEIEFDREFAAIPAQTFVNSILLDRLYARSVHVGFNFRFGHERKGDTALLRDVLDSQGAELTVQDPVEIDGLTVSSTEIRKRIRNGNVKEARKLLGRPYLVYETLERGEGRGQSIGFPTFNFPLRRTLHPRRGVYVVWLESDRLHPAVANFGRHPTVGESDEPLLEVHVLNEPPQLEIGDRSHVHIARFLRAEEDFESVEQLKDQIEIDKERAREIHDSLTEPDSLGSSAEANSKIQLTEV